MVGALQKLRWPPNARGSEPISHKASSTAWKIPDNELVDSVHRFPIPSFWTLCCHGIGSVSAGYLSQICINLPRVEDVDRNAVIRDDELKALRLLQEMSRDLTILKGFVYDRNSRGLTPRSCSEDILRFIREELRLRYCRCDAWLWVDS